MIYSSTRLPDDEVLLMPMFLHNLVPIPIKIVFGHLSLNLSLIPWFEIFYSASPVKKATNIKWIVGGEKDVPTNKLMG